MDFEKLYKQALERAKAGKPMDEVFPELKESEDERIRKAIVEHFKAYSKKENIVSYFGVATEDIIAYLKKRKEQKPAEINVKALLAADRLASAEMTGRLKERSEILENPEKYGLHKPAEWSEEDKTNGWRGVDLERYLSCLQRLGTGNPQQPETINSKWFKEHCRPQLKREDWTEEDSIAIKEIQNALEVYMIKHGISEKQRKKLARWLDIHFNAYPLPAKLYHHWKPTKEQMAALEASYSVLKAHDIWGEDEHLPLLLSLCNDLKNYFSNEKIH